MASLHNKPLQHLRLNNYHFMFSFFSIAHLNQPQSSNLIIIIYLFSCCVGLPHSINFLQGSAHFIKYNSHFSLLHQTENFTVYIVTSYIGTAKEVRRCSSSIIILTRFRLFIKHTNCRSHGSFYVFSTVSRVAICNPFR